MNLLPVIRPIASVPKATCDHSRLSTRGREREYALRAGEDDCWLDVALRIMIRQGGRSGVKANLRRAADLGGGCALGISLVRNAHPHSKGSKSRVVIVVCAILAQAVVEFRNLILQTCPGFCRVSGRACARRPVSAVCPGGRKRSSTG